MLSLSEPVRLSLEDRAGLLTLTPGFDRCFTGSLAFEWQATQLGDLCCKGLLGSLQLTGYSFLRTTERLEYETDL